MDGELTREIASGCPLAERKSIWLARNLMHLSAAVDDLLRRLEEHIETKGHPWSKAMFDASPERVIDLDDIRQLHWIVGGTTR